MMSVVLIITGRSRFYLTLVLLLTQSIIPCSFPNSHLSDSQILFWVGWIPTYLTVSRLSSSRMVWCPFVCRLSWMFLRVACWGRCFSCLSMTYHRCYLTQSMSFIPTTSKFIFTVGRQFYVTRPSASLRTLERSVRELKEIVLRLMSVKLKRSVLR